MSIQQKFLLDVLLVLSRLCLLPGCSPALQTLILYISLRVELQGRDEMKIYAV
jgi:hypothetical protein